MQCAEQTSVKYQEHTVSPEANIQRWKQQRKVFQLYVNTIAWIQRQNGSQALCNTFNLKSIRNLHSALGACTNDAVELHLRSCHQTSRQWQ